MAVCCSSSSTVAQSQPSPESVQVLDRRVQVKDKDRWIYGRFVKKRKSFFPFDTEMRCSGLVVSAPLQTWACQALLVILCMFSGVFTNILLEKSATSACFSGEG